jgi:peptidoglycan L-alanyl-D-glutamate endopeptidase CwlK
MSKRLNDLSPDFRPKAIELIARCIERGLPVAIIDTLRTPEEHAANLAKGVSWTKRSKHLDGDAIDLAPYDVYQLHGPDKFQWSAADPAWQIIGEEAERLGLRWGGRWTQKDMGHAELVRP